MIEKWVIFWLRSGKKNKNEKISALWYLACYLKITKTSIYNPLISKWLLKHAPILELTDKLCNVLTAIFDGDYSKREA